MRGHALISSVLRQGKVGNAVGRPLRILKPRVGGVALSITPGHRDRNPAVVVAAFPPFGSRESPGRDSVPP